MVNTLYYSISLFPVQMHEQTSHYLSDWYVGTITIVYKFDFEYYECGHGGFQDSYSRRVYDSM